MGNNNIDWESRRFLIAMHAMQGIIANSHTRDYRTEGYGATYKDSPSEIAYRAVAYAEALILMLKQQENKNNGSDR